MRHHFKHFSCDTKTNMDAVRLLHAIQQHENVNRRNRERVMKDHVDPYDFYNNSELVDRFRFNREGLLFIENLVQQALERETLKKQLKNQKLECLTKIKLIITLRYTPMAYVKHLSRIAFWVWGLRMPF